MSRIQEILKKAEREGSVHRTRPIVTDPPVRALVDRPPVSRAEPPAVGRVEPPAPIGFAPPVTPARDRSADVDARLVAASAPQSIAAEQYRLLRTRIARAENGRVFRAIIVTSPNTGDGKSLTASNLALTMAQDPQQRVLLLDADLRRPSIHQLFGVSETPGLSDILMGGATIEDALVALPDQRLTILPSGLIPSQPAELLGSAGMHRLLDILRSRFDRILIDMPPVAPLADVAIASTMADGVLMIVRAGVTPKPAIERALSGIETGKVLGLVLNDAGGSSGGYEYAGYRYVAG